MAIVGELRSPIHLRSSGKTAAHPSWTKGGPTPDQQKVIADATFRNRQTLSPYLKAMLALTLKRLGRRADGLLVLAGLLDVAKDPSRLALRAYLKSPRSSCRGMYPTSPLTLH